MDGALFPGVPAQEEEGEGLAISCDQIARVQFGRLKKAIELNLRLGQEDTPAMMVKRVGRCGGIGKKGLEDQASDKGRV